MYADVERSHGLLMDGGIPTGFDNLLWQPPLCQGLRQPSFLDIAWAMIQIRAAGSPEVGIGGRLAQKFWRAFTLTGADVLADDTVDAQDADASDFPLEIAADNNSGFMISSPFLFNLLDILIGTASTGTNPTRILQYSGPAGWVTITNPLVAPVSGGHYAVGENLIWWAIPQNHVKMTVALHGAGVPVGEYGIRCRSTTVPGTVQAVATSLSVAHVKSIRNLASDNTFGWVPSISKLHIDVPCDGLVGVSSVAHDSNQFSALVKARG